VFLTLLKIIYTSVLGLRGKVLVAGGATGMTAVRSCWKLPLCPIEPVPDGSKTDPLLVKTKPISEGGSTSVIMYLRSGKSCWTTALAEERSESM